MLRRLRVQNFRLLRDVEIAFEEDVPTVFIGPNGSGKSTILEALDFLARCSTDGLQAAALAHGGIHSLRTIGVDAPVSFDLSWVVATDSSTPNERLRRLHWAVSLQPEMTGAVTVLREELKDDAWTPPRVLVSSSDQGSRTVLADSDLRARSSKIGSRAKLSFEEISDPGRFKALDLLRRLLSEIHIIGAISTAPSWARVDRTTASPRDSLVLGPQTFLDRQGLGLANVLFGLFNNHRDEWGELERAFRAEFPFVRRVVFPSDAGASKIAFAIEDERFPGRKLFASEMSDGMIGYLCLLSAVLHPEQIGILALDEPDANLHPSALRRLMALAHRENERRHLVIVTHSNALLEELRDPARIIRVVESTKTGARIRQLDAAAFSAWRKEYTLSEMRRTGLLDPSSSA